MRLPLEPVRMHLLELAPETDGDGDAALKVLVHLWSFARRLQEEHAPLRTVSLDTEDFPQAPTLAVNIQGLNIYNVVNFYKGMLKLLRKIDAEIGPKVKGRKGGSISIRGPKGWDRLPNQVFWWPMFGSELRRLFLAQKFTHYDYGPESTLEYIGLSSDDRLSAHPIMPNKRPAALVDVSVAKIRIALCTLPGVEPRFRVSGTPPAFGEDTPVFEDEAAVQAKLLQLLTYMAEQEVHLLVLPELLVPPVMRGYLQDRLKVGGNFPYAIVAGSGYEEIKGERRNTSSWLDRSGRTIGQHHKAGYFSLKASEARKLRIPGIPDDLAADERVTENIQLGYEFKVLETKTGRIGVLICADLLDLKAGFWTLVSETARLDLLLVVSLSPSTRDFQHQAKTLCRMGTTTLFVNTAFVVHGEADLAFIISPFRKDHLIAQWRKTANGCILQSKGEVVGIESLPDDAGLIIDLAQCLEIFSERE